MILANTRPRPGGPREQELDDRRRRAMFARMRGGGGGGGGGDQGGPPGGRPNTTPSTNTNRPTAYPQTTPSPYPAQPPAGSYGPNDPIPSFWRAAMSGLWEGAVGGFSITTDALTFGLSDYLGITDSDQYQGGDYDFSRSAAGIGRDALLAASGLGLAGRLGFTGIGSTAASQHAALLRAIGGFGSQQAIEDYINANPTMDPDTMRYLSYAAQAAGYAGASGVLGSARQYGGALLQALPGIPGLAASGGSLAAQLRAALAGTDAVLGSAGQWLAQGINPTVLAGLQRAHGLYTATANFTGSTLRDLVAVAANPGAATAGQWLAAGYVGAGVTARELYELNAIDNYREQAAQAIREGRSFEYPADDPRGIVGTVLAAITGTLGNPVERQFRPGLQTRLAEQGAYRAGYDAIMEAESRGEISTATAQQALERLAASRPANMAGGALWSFAGAAQAFLNWQVGDMIDTARLSTVTPVTRVVDGDTVIVGYHFPGQSASQAGEIRFLDINTPETVHPTVGVEMYGPESSSRMHELLQSGQYVRVVEDSNPRAAGTDHYGRQLGYVETLPQPFDQLLRLPYVGPYIPAIDLNRTMIEEGLADIHYRQLSGRTDRARDYDAARAIAQANETGIWSPEARAALDWVGTERTVAERMADWYRSATGNEPPATPVGDLTTALGLGLMTSGNSGIFQRMPASGNALAQTYNAVLAALGALEYNERARNAAPRDFDPPSVVPTDYDRRINELFNQ